MTTQPSGASAGGVNGQIGRRIQGHLADVGMTQGQLAAALGLTQAAVSRKLSGGRPWFPDELAHVALVLRVPVGELFGEDQQAAPGLALAGAVA